VTSPSLPPPASPAVGSIPGDASSGAGSRHRADIQGLRAIAVLAVLAVHVGISSVTGGFVGVDVFFAISGFLITQQLIRSAERQGRVSLVSFYARRARRILPAATLVLLVTVTYAALELGFLRTQDIVKDAIWSACFAANIRFSALETDYFAADLPPSPLQHFWSLAVEEQFYLVWPLLVVLGYWLYRRRERLGLDLPGDARRGLTIAVAVMTLLSLLWSAHTTGQDPAAAYFSPFTRAWELGLGALAALAIREDGPQDRTARWRAQTLGIAGVFLILSACLQFNEATPFPGTPALVPVLGSVFILVAGSLWHGPTIVSRLLAVRPLLILGNWSYSLYLWHFPLLVLPEIQAGHELGWFSKSLLLVLAVVLSGLSFRYVEEPIRRGRYGVGNLGNRFGRTRAIALYPLSLGLVVAMGMGANSYAQFLIRGGDYQPAISVAGADTSPGEPSDAPSGKSSAAATEDAPEVPAGPSLELVRASVKAARGNERIPSDLQPALEDLASDTADVGACDYLEGSRDLCKRGDTDGDKTMVLLGDSHARHWIPAFEQIATETGYQAYYLVRPQCQASLVTPDVLHSTSPDTDCADFHSWAISQIKKLHPDLLVISSSPGRGGIHDGGTRVTDRESMDQLSYQGYLGLLDRVKPAAERTVWMRDTPKLDGDPGTCLSSNRDLGPCLFDTESTHTTSTNLQMAAAKARKVDTVDINRWICWQDDCPPVVGSVTTFRDNQHLTTTYAAWLAGPLGTALGMW